MGLLSFLKGVAGKLRGWMWFFGGENVVGCVVDVEFSHHVFGLRKMRQLFEIYFQLAWRFGRGRWLVTDSRQPPIASSIGRRTFLVVAGL